MARPVRTRRAEVWYALSLLCAGCGRESSSDQGSGGATDPYANHVVPAADPVPIPVLSHAVIDLDGSLDPASGSLGALRCKPSAAPDGGASNGDAGAEGDAGTSEDAAAFDPDASAAAAGAPSGDAYVPEPSATACVRAFDALADEDFALGTLRFVSEAGATVFAAAAGTVTDVLERNAGNGVYRIRVRLSDDSPFWLEYLHVVDPAVVVGETIEAGTILGAAGPHVVGRSMVGFAVVRDQFVYQRLCPVRYAEPALRERLDSAALAAGISQLCSTTSLVCSETPCTEASVFHELGGDLDQGRGIFQQTCANCHGRTGQSLHGCDPSCSHSAVVSKIIAYEMPPIGDKCIDACADDVAAHLLHDIFPNRQQ